MKTYSLFLFLFFTVFSQAQNQATESPVSMNQLLKTLGMFGGNWTFNFDEPVYACIKSEISESVHNDDITTRTYISDKASQEISLYYLDAPDTPGQQTNVNNLNGREIQFKLSDCRETGGTSLLRYYKKFSSLPWSQKQGSTAHFRPAIANSPELNKEYILTYYFQKGEQYQAKVTICFVKQPEDLDQVSPFGRDGVTRFTTTSE